MDASGGHVIYPVPVCALAEAVASIRNDEKRSGEEFVGGIHGIAPIFLPVTGIADSV